MPETPWLVVRMPRPAASLRIVCLPFAGGNAGAFDSWGTRFPASVEVCAVQYPGRRERLDEPMPRRMSLLLQTMEAGLTRQLDRPYVLFGNSLGAVVAFELVRRLARRGRPVPLRLVVSSAQAPHTSEPLPDYPRMSDNELVDALVSLNTMSTEMARYPELLAATLPTVRADFELARSYRYHDDGTVHIPIDVLSGASDRFVPAADLHEWSELTTAGTTTTLLPGGHDLLARSSGELIAAVVSACARADPTILPPQFALRVPVL